MAGYIDYGLNMEHRLLQFYWVGAERRIPNIFLKECNLFLAEIKKIYYYVNPKNIVDDPTNTHIK